jgi:hypothetical protein
MLVVVKDNDDRTCYAYDARTRLCSFPTLEEVAEVECVTIDALIALRVTADRQGDGSVVHH